jgi:transcriptional regulator with XRE-family HTH domain
MRNGDDRDGDGEHVSLAARHYQESAQELLKKLGAHLRAARLERRFTLAQVAERAGLTKGFLSQLERGESSASISSLLALCGVLEIPIARLLEAASVATVASPLVRHSERKTFYLGGEGVRDELVSPPRDRRFEVFETRIEPHGSPGEEPYTLDAEFGFAYVLQGRLEFFIGGASHILERGDTITYSPRDPHTFRNPSSSRSTVVIFMKSPAVF